MSDVQEQIAKLDDLGCSFCNYDYSELKAAMQSLVGRNALLEEVVKDFKQFAAYLAVKTEYDLFRKTEEYARFFDNLAKLNLDSKGEET